MRIYFIRHAEGEHNLSPECWEIKYPKLTEKGRNQSIGNRKFFEKINIDLIVVSPLKRTLETAELIFGKDENYISLEYIKEHVVNNCDLRESKDDLISLFPYVNFNFIEDYQGYNDKESDDQIDKRLDNFYQWLIKCPKKEVAVVSHGQYLLRFLKKYGKNLNIDNFEWFENCEIRVGTYN